MSMSRKRNMNFEPPAVPAPAPQWPPGRLDREPREGSWPNRESRLTVRYGSVFEAEAAETTAGEGLVDWLRLLYRRRGILVCCLLGGALAGLLASLPRVPVYHASAELEVRDFDKTFPGVTGGSPTRTANGSSSRSGIATHIHVLQSQGLIRRTLAKAGVRADESTAATRGWWHGAAQLAGWSGDTDATSREGAAAMAAARLQVRIVGETRILEVATESTNPAFTAEFVNLLAETYIEENLAGRWRTARRTERWLEEQLDHLRAKLETSERALQDYARESGLTFVSARESAAEENLRRLQLELSRARASRIAKQSAYEQMRQSSAKTFPEGAGRAALDRYQAQLTDLRRQQADLLQVFTPAHPKVKRVAAQIAELRTAATKERTAMTERVASDYETSRRREDLLASDYELQRELVASQAAKSVEYHILQREARTNQELYEGFLKKVRQAEVARALAVSPIRIVDRAATPDAPVGPNHVLATATGAIGALLLGIAFVFVRDRTDHALRQPGDTLDWLSAPELGAIPVIDPLSGTDGPRPSARSWRVSAPGRRFLWGAPRLGGGGSGLRGLPAGSPAASGGASLEKIAAEQAASPAAESFRALVTSILFAAGRRKVFVVTSDSAGDGKTTIVSNLAISLSQVGRRVLLVDGNLRNPSLHHIFGVANDSGVSNALGPEPSPRLGRQDPAVRETQISGLFVLPAGPPSPLPSRLLHSARLPELLEHLSRDFDVILIDTPATTAFADARIFSRFADAAILILRAGQTTGDQARAAENLLTADGSLVLGTILNAWIPPKADMRRYERAARNVPTSSAGRPSASAATA